MQKELKVCLEAAAAGADVIRKYTGKKFSVRHKGEINLVTEVDEKAQAAIVKVIHKHFKKDAILAEEGQFSSTASAPRRWIIDPIDGTTNFAHGYPKFCVSIAFEQEGVLKAGVIHDPNLKEIFYATKGGGAFCNKKKIRVSKTEKLIKALLVTGFAYDLDNPAYDNIPHFLHFLRRAQAVRRDGSAALNLAYVAAGRFDGIWEKALNPWDIAAGILLISEAGGKITTMDGKPLALGHHALMASNPILYNEFLREILKVSGKNRK